MLTTPLSVLQGFTGKLEQLGNPSVHIATWPMVYSLYKINFKGHINLLSFIKTFKCNLILANEIRNG